MSKKKEDEEKVEEQVETPTKTSSKKTSKKEEKKTDDAELKTLRELVDECRSVTPFSLFSSLSSKGYIEQYYDELDKYRKGLNIEPTITVEEFNKIIGE